MPTYLVRYGIVSRALRTTAPRRGVEYRSVIRNAATVVLIFHIAPNVVLVVNLRWRTQMRTR